MRPLSRTAHLADFEGCCSVADWQQALAQAAYQQWRCPHVSAWPAPAAACVLNWGAAAFTAPGGVVASLSYGESVETCPGQIDTLYALSVLDRVEAPVRFLRQAAGRLRPGGLLVATFAAWDADGPDEAVGCELRKRIYNRTSIRKLLMELPGVGLAPFGGVDLRYHGDSLGDHTLASLVAVTVNGGSR